MFTGVVRGAIWATRRHESLEGCKVEPFVADAAPGSRFQFERQGYFCIDIRDSAADALVFNRTVSLRDTWARMQKKQGK